MSEKTRKKINFFFNHKINYFLDHEVELDALFLDLVNHENEAFFDFVTEYFQLFFLRKNKDLKNRVQRYLIYGLNILTGKKLMKLTILLNRFFSQNIHFNSMQKWHQFYSQQLSEEAVQMLSQKHSNENVQIVY